ncbi:MAG TPA: TIGR03915 family putative DNA repair protein [Gemmatimonadaceae bacterium]|nr:TIGR03915 family putative DNA repair protein [Gemmatimonadaceae bacterium]
MIRAEFDGTYDGWRAAARSLLHADVPPDRIAWTPSSDVQQSLLAAESLGTSDPAQSISVPKEFMRLAECVACYRDEARWPLLYNVLWRITHGERSLLHIVVDRDVHSMYAMESAVRRDEHKMKAFVRFRRVGNDDEAEARYVAWFAPAHLIVDRVAPFFARRFASMYWSILTPDGSIHWNKEEVAFGPPLNRSDAPASDELETLWRTYYASVFNPARLKLRAMRSEMPKKYWSGLPEAGLIPGLVANAPRRVREMGVDEAKAK